MYYHFKLTVFVRELQWESLQNLSAPFQVEQKFKNWSSRILQSYCVTDTLYNHLCINNGMQHCCHCRYGSYHHFFTTILPLKHQHYHRHGATATIIPQLPPLSTNITTTTTPIATSTTPRKKLALPPQHHHQYHVHLTTTIWKLEKIT